MCDEERDIGCAQDAVSIAAVKKAGGPAAAIGTQGHNTVGLVYHCSQQLGRGHSLQGFKGYVFIMVAQVVF